LATATGNRANEMASYIIQHGGGLSRDLRLNLFVLGELYQILYENGESDLGKKFEEMYEKHLADLQIGREDN
jgi:hypothetical protein